MFKCVALRDRSGFLPFEIVDEGASVDVAAVVLNAVFEFD